MLVDCVYLVAGVSDVYDLRSPRFRSRRSFRISYSVVSASRALIRIYYLYIFHELTIKIHKNLNKLNKFKLMVSHIFNSSTRMDE